MLFAGSEPDIKALELVDVMLDDNGLLLVIRALLLVHNFSPGNQFAFINRELDR